MENSRSPQTHVHFIFQSVAPEMKDEMHAYPDCVCVCVFVPLLVMGERNVCQMILNCIVDLIRYASTCFSRVCRADDDDNKL